MKTIVTTPHPLHHLEERLVDVGPGLGRRLDEQQVVVPRELLPLLRAYRTPGSATPLSRQPCLILIIQDIDAKAI